MAISPVDLLTERERQFSASDGNFFRRFIYYFELRVPPELAPGTGGQFIFPLALGPEQYSISEPFTVEATPTQGGGLYVEENGIVQRTIRLSGHTGFRPRRLPSLVGATGLGATALVALKSSEQSFSRVLPATVLRSISGQRHFQYLQDAVFRTYADLKRDPSTAEATKLIFHNPKESESWHVVPRTFTGARTKDRRTLYPYDIELLVVDKATSLDKDFSEDKSLLDRVRDAQRMVQSGLDMAAGALNDLTALASELRSLALGFNTIVDTATSVLAAASDFVDGVVAAIEVPYATLNSVNELIDEVAAFVVNAEEAGNAILAIPENVIQKFRQLADGLDRIGTHPEVFQSSALANLQIQKNQQELFTAVAAERLSDAETSDAPTTLAEAGALGTALTPGDVRSAQAELGAGRTVSNYTGARLVSVSQRDTLVSLASRYLGDARQWQHLAAINGLKPPFLNDQATADLSVEDVPFSGALGMGGKILIPNFSQPPSELPLLPVLGVREDEPAEIHLLGTDVAMEPVVLGNGREVLDVPIDAAGGSSGPKLVSGVANIGQSLFLRLRIEKGSDTLYQRVGLGRVVGTNRIVTDLENARFKLLEALTQDSRVSAVRRLDFSDSTADALVIDADVELRGFTETANVKTSVE